MVKACLIYKHIKEYASIGDNVFCDLHYCGVHEVCDHKQRHCMLNFDEVKNVYCRNNGITPCKSVDGLSYNDNGILFFIEIKGWNLYSRYANPKNEQDVKNKVVKYGLSNKLYDSLKICKKIHKDREDRIDVPLVYLVVSDIKNEGIESIEINLSLLAGISSRFSTVYGDAIESQLSNIHDVDVGFVKNCEQIDAELESWKDARKVSL